ncbi:hypothetical protein WKE96_13605 [Edwardsiella tarda]|uniref:hypothetical protein n=1 Tax=Edwardsiella tarda TaxID=636 RepID=UPI0039BDFA19
MELLEALQKARDNLISRSLNEDPQLFSCLFQYENNETLLCLSFEREFSIFLNENLEKISNKITNIEDNDVQNSLKYVVGELVRFKDPKKTSTVDTFFIRDKINQIDKIFSIFKKDQGRTEEINYIRRKEQVLFDRTFKKLLGE